MQTIKKKRKNWRKAFRAPSAAPPARASPPVALSFSSTLRMQDGGELPLAAAWEVRKREVVRDGEKLDRRRSPSQWAVVSFPSPCLFRSRQVISPHHSNSYTHATRRMSSSRVSRAWLLWKTRNQLSQRSMRSSAAAATKEPVAATFAGTLQSCACSRSAPSRSSRATSRVARREGAAPQRGGRPAAAKMGAATASLRPEGRAPAARQRRTVG